MLDKQDMLDTAGTNSEMTFFQLTSTYGHTSADRLEKTSKHQFCTNTGCSQISRFGLLNTPTASLQRGQTSPMNYPEVPVVQSLSQQEMDTATRVQILDETDCISHSTNTLGKGMNPIILPPAMGKQQGRLGPSALVRQLVQEKENSEFKPVKLRLKIDLVSYPARAEGLVNSTNELSGQDTKQSNDKNLVILGIWGMCSTPSLPLLQDLLWFGVVAPDTALSMDQMELFDIQTVYKQMTDV